MRMCWYNLKSLKNYEMRFEYDLCNRTMFLKLYNERILKIRVIRKSFYAVKSSKNYGMCSTYDCITKQYF